MIKSIINLATKCLTMMGIKTPSSARPLMAFNGKQSTKDFYTSRVDKAQRSGQIFQKDGYWELDNKEGPLYCAKEVFRGRSVECTIHSNSYDTYEKELGVPVRIVHLMESTFETLADKVAGEFPLKFIQAIPVGADLSMVLSYLMLWMLVDETYGVINGHHTPPNHRPSKAKKAMNTVVELYKLRLSGDEPTTQMWMDTLLAAYRAAYTASVGAAARAASYGSIYHDDDARCAARAVSSAAQSAYTPYASSQQRFYQQEYYKAVHDKLLELLAAAPPHADYKAAASFSI